MATERRMLEEFYTHPDIEHVQTFTKDGIPTTIFAFGAEVGVKIECRPDASVAPYVLTPIVYHQYPGANEMNYTTLYDDAEVYETKWWVDKMLASRYNEEVKLREVKDISDLHGDWD